MTINFERQQFNKLTSWFITGAYLVITRYLITNLKCMAVVCTQNYWIANSIKTQISLFHLWTWILGLFSPALLRHLFSTFSSTCERCINPYHKNSSQKVWMNAEVRKHFNVLRKYYVTRLWCHRETEITRTKKNQAYCTVIDRFKKFARLGTSLF